jgi:tyrosyl-tRNA synthetase
LTPAQRWGPANPANLDHVSQLNDLESQQNDPTFANIWQELNWRGLVHVSTDEV